MRAFERLLRYARVDTTSDETTGVTPSTPGQLDLAVQLADELRSLSFEGVRVSDDGFVYGFLPATPGLDALPCLGLIAHMDTAPDFSGKDVRPQIVENYDGGEVVLAGSGDVLSPAQFPTLASLKGKTLITTDGTTLLGADDQGGRRGDSHRLRRNRALRHAALPSGRLLHTGRGNRRGHRTLRRGGIRRGLRLHRGRRRPGRAGLRKLQRLRRVL